MKYIKLKHLLLETHEIPKLSSSDIYNFYFLWNISLNRPDLIKTEYGDYIYDVYMKNLKHKYIRAFKQILSNQLFKYYQRQRIMPGFDVKLITANNSPSTLEKQMKLTKRSDMKRDNDRWNQLASYVTNLESASSFADMSTYIDKINNTVHNTRTTILDKFANSRELFNALTNSSKILKLDGMLPYVDKDLKDLLSQENANVYENTDEFDTMQSFKKIHLNNLDDFTKSYIKCALWSSTDNLTSSGGDPLDKKYTIEDIESSTLSKMEHDCQDFQQKYKALYESGGWDDDQAGYDFWLTRNGHGTGFWDRGYDYDAEDIGKQLTIAAKSYGTFDIYLGDGKYDGLICGG